MCPLKHCTEPRRQQGNMLLEAMVGMVIVGLVAAASVYAIGRGTNLQYAAGLRAQAVEQLRALMLSQGASMCATGAPNIAVTIGGAPQSLPVTVSHTAPYCGGYANVGVTLPGASTQTVTVGASQASPMQLAVNAQALGGAITVTSN